MTSDELRALADAAESSAISVLLLQDVLGPDAARLLADAMDALRSIDHSAEDCEGECAVSRADLFEQIDGAALLARFAALGKETTDE